MTPSRLASLRMLTVVLAAGSTLACGATIFTAIQANAAIVPAAGVVFMAITSVSLIGGLVAVPWWFAGQRHNRVSPEATGPERATLYAQEWLVRVALLDATAIVAAVGYLVSRQMLLLPLIPFGLGAMLVLMPSMRRFAAWDAGNRRLPDDRSDHPGEPLA